MSTIKSSAEHLTLNADGSGNDIKFQSNGTEVASISDGGVITATTFTGSATDSTKVPLAGGTMTGDLILGDNVSLELGAGSNGDLQIYHDASNSHIDSKTGILKIRSDDLRIFNQVGSETLAKMVNGGAVELYHNDSKKIETTSGGATVTGTLGVTTVDLGNWTITESSGVLYFATGGTNKMKLDASGNLTCVGDVTANGSM